MNNIIKLANQLQESDDDNSTISLEKAFSELLIQHEAALIEFLWDHSEANSVFANSRIIEIPDNAAFLAQLVHPSYFSSVFELANNLSDPKNKFVANYVIELAEFCLTIAGHVLLKLTCDHNNQVTMFLPFLDNQKINFTKALVAKVSQRSNKSTNDRSNGDYKFLRGSSLLYFELCRVLYNFQRDMRSCYNTANSCDNVNITKYMFDQLKLIEPGDSTDRSKCVFIEVRDFQNKIFRRIKLTQLTINAITIIVNSDSFYLTAVTHIPEVLKNFAKANLLTWSKVVYSLDVDRFLSVYTYFQHLVKEADILFEYCDRNIEQLLKTHARIKPLLKHIVMKNRNDVFITIVKTRPQVYSELMNLPADVLLDFLADHQVTLAYCEWYFSPSQRVDHSNTDFTNRLTQIANIIQNSNDEHFLSTYILMLNCTIKNEPVRKFLNDAFNNYHLQHLHTYLALLNRIYTFSPRSLPITESWFTHSRKIIKHLISRYELAFTNVEVITNKANTNKNAWSEDTLHTFVQIVKLTNYFRGNPLDHADLCTFLELAHKQNDRETIKRVLELFTTIIVWFKPTIRTRALLFEAVSRTFFVLEELKKLKLSQELQLYFLINNFNELQLNEPCYDALAYELAFNNNQTVYCALKDVILNTIKHRIKHDSYSNEYIQAVARYCSITARILDTFVSKSIHSQLLTASKCSDANEPDTMRAICLVLIKLALLNLKTKPDALKHIKEFLLHTESLIYPLNKTQQLSVQVLDAMINAAVNFVRRIVKLTVADDFKDEVKEELSETGCNISELFDFDDTLINYFRNPEPSKKRRHLFDPADLVFMDGNNVYCYSSNTDHSTLQEEFRAWLKNNRSLFAKKKIQVQLCDYLNKFTDVTLDDENCNMIASNIQKLATAYIAVTPDLLSILLFHFPYLLGKTTQQQRTVAITFMTEIIHLETLDDGSINLSLSTVKQLFPKELFQTCLSLTTDKQQQLCQNITLGLSYICEIINASALPAPTMSGTFWANIDYYDLYLSEKPQLEDVPNVFENLKAVETRDDIFDHFVFEGALSFVVALLCERDTVLNRNCIYVLCLLKRMAVGSVLRAKNKYCIEQKRIQLVNSKYNKHKTVSFFEVNYNVQTFFEIVATACFNSKTYLELQNELLNVKQSNSDRTDNETNSGENYVQDDYKDSHHYDDLRNKVYQNRYYDEDNDQYNNDFQEDYGDGNNDQYPEHAQRYDSQDISSTANFDGFKRLKRRVSFKRTQIALPILSSFLISLTVTNFALRKLVMSKKHLCHYDGHAYPATMKLLINLSNKPYLTFLCDQIKSKLSRSDLKNTEKAMFKSILTILTN